MCTKHLSVARCFVRPLGSTYLFNLSSHFRSGNLTVQSQGSDIPGLQVLNKQLYDLRLSRHEGYLTCTIYKNYIDNLQKNLIQSNIVYSQWRSFTSKVGGDIIIMIYMLTDTYLYITQIYIFELSVCLSVCLFVYKTKTNKARMLIFSLQDTYHLSYSFQLSITINFVCMYVSIYVYNDLE